MKVKELVELLQQLNPDARVFIVNWERSLAELTAYEHSDEENAVYLTNHSGEGE